MKSLIFSCRNEFSAKQTLLLVSAILAGYCTRACAEYYTVDHVSPKARHAPVISVRYFDHAYPVLEKIVEALAINTSVLYPEAYAFSSELLESKYSPILPKRTEEHSVTDSAYLKLPGLPHQIMPQYRDTTLLIHGRFFPSSEAAKLQRLNQLHWRRYKDFYLEQLLSLPLVLMLLEDDTTTVKPASDGTVEY